MNIELHDFSSVCRICQCKKRRMISIFESGPDKNIADMILRSTNIKVQFGDRLPNNVCPNCLTQLTAVINFQNLALESDEIFKSILKKCLDRIETSEDCTSEISDINYENDYCSNEFVEVKVEPTFENIPEDSPPTRSPKKGRKKRKKDPVTNYTRYRPTKNYRCDECGIKFERQRHRDSHNHRIHGIKLPLETFIDNTKKCSHKNCSLTFQTWAALKIHEKETGHVYKEQCPYCPAKFKRDYYASHVQRHRDALLCQQCGKSFFKKLTLRRHMRDCLRLEKPFKCSFCNEGFHIRSKLDEHVRKHTNDKPFVCEECGASFRLKIRLKYHMAKHSDARPYVCKICQKGFKVKPSLDVHQRVHTGERKYVCTGCGASYGYCGRLKSHQVKCPFFNRDDKSVPLNRVNDTPISVNTSGEVMFLS